ncbi:hypothetical protein M8C22_13395 [Bacillus spizizenii]|uniref:hypothetical protein n=1 Tax=Bacillus spizizenii TaxID=96241 RepID=UPI0009A2A165|nr:hypothetical protein [Bacillus spizizenii]OPG92833.1 hypothetical protein B2I22_07750 [Bacillus spizizenii]
MRTINIFLFYLFYLLAAEFPLFLILSIRNFKTQNITIFLFMLILSSILNLLIFIILICKMKERLPGGSLNTSRITKFSENKIKQSLSDFFGFFLLPFFTFNFSGDVELVQLIIEMFILLTLLTIFLIRTKNYTSNIFVYMIFNLYECEVPGKQIVLITTSYKADIQSDANSELKQIFQNTYIYEKNKGVISKLYWFITFFAVAIVISLILIVYLNELINLDYFFSKK